MTATLGNHPAGLVYAVLAMSVFFRYGHTTGSPEEACEKKEKLQETDEVKGIHDFDVCQLIPHMDVPASEQPSRICTAHLALIEGHGQVIAPATCFLPDPEKNGIYLQKQEKGWAFNGKLSLTCGPHMYSFELESTFKEPKVLLHPKFMPEKKFAFAQPHNIAVVRISREVYADALARTTAWEFARVSEPVKELSADTVCRCYAGTAGAPGAGEPPEYRVKRCELWADHELWRQAKEQDCFRILQSENPGPVYKEIDSMTHECGTKKYCGIRQTMACFCGTTADELKSLHSIGSYFYNKAVGEVRVYSLPLKGNWDFLRSSVDSSSPIGATDAQLANVQKHLGEAADQCFAQKNGGAEMKSFVKKTLCETPDETTDKQGITEEFKKNLKALIDCMSKQTKIPDTNGRELLIPPIEQTFGLAYLVADDKVCAKAGIVEAAKRLRKKLKRRMRCFAITFRESYDDQMTHNPWGDEMTFKNAFDENRKLAIVATGVVPGLIGEAIKKGCRKIDPKMKNAVAAFRSCMVVSTIFLSPAYAVDGVVMGFLMSPIEVPKVINAAVSATKEAKKVH